MGKLRDIQLEIAVMDYDAIGRNDTIGKVGPTVGISLVDVCFLWKELCKCDGVLVPNMKV